MELTLNTTLWNSNGHLKIQPVSWSNRSYFSLKHVSLSKQRIQSTWNDEWMQQLQSSTSYPGICLHDRIRILCTEQLFLSSSLKLLSAALHISPKPNKLNNHCWCFRVHLSFVVISLTVNHYKTDYNTVAYWEYNNLLLSPSFICSFV